MLRFRIGDTQVMASDGMNTGRPSFQGFALSLTASDEVEAKRLFAALGEGGKVQMPLTKTFYSPAFGMVADRFGVLRRSRLCTQSEGVNGRSAGHPGGGAGSQKFRR